jgi:hypothetical protein
MTLYDCGSKAIRSVRPGGYMRVKHPFVRLLLSTFFTLMCGCLAYRADPGVSVNRNWPTFDHPIWHTPLVNQLRGSGRSVVLRRP